MNTPTQEMKARMAPGKRDLSAAAKLVHAKPKAPKKRSELNPASIPDHLLTAAGDAPERSSFFEHDDTQKAMTRQGRKVYMVLGAKAALPDYRTRDNQRTHRSMITVPPKVRESICELFGVDSSDEVAWSTALIALADYGALALRRDKKCLQVEPAADPLAAERKEAKKAIRHNSRS